MKTIKLLALMLVALVGMTACSDDEDNKKNIIDPVVQEFKGTNAVMVGGTMGPYYADITCKVTTNTDGTLTVEIPEYALHNTAIGELTVGTITISNIAFDAEKNAFYRAYAADELTEHIKIEGRMSVDGDYSFAEGSFIQIEQTEAGIKFTNSFSFGKMPFAIVSTFETAAE